MISKILSIFMLYVASLLYVSASYIHLSFQSWTFTKAYLFALPFVFIEYIFKIYGTKFSSDNGLNILQIMLLVIAFYMVNVWIINIFIIKHQVDYLRESVSLALLFIAILLSGNFVGIRN